MSETTKIDWSPPMPDDQMAAAYQSVQAKLTRTAGGEVRNTLQNFVTALTHDPVFAGNIRRNLFKERMSMTCPVWWARKSDMIDDMDAAFLRLYLEEHYGLRSEKLIYPALNIVSTAQAFHPVRDRLNSLVWDGVPRVRVALHHFLGAEVSDTNEKYLRTFMLGAANRVFHPGCKFELMLVLVGGQGAGKTTFIRFLALEPEWFTDDVANWTTRRFTIGSTVIGFASFRRWSRRRMPKASRKSSRFSAATRIFCGWHMIDTAAIIPGKACSRARPTAWISCRWTEAAIGAFSR